MQLPDNLKADIQLKSVSEPPDNFDWREQG
jgi:hypothetical protein